MKLVKASLMPTAFQNMFNLYAHELSAYNPWLGTKIDENGNFLPKVVKDYLDEGSFQSWCITENDRPIGLAVFSSEEENGVFYHDIEELFLIKTARKSGFAAEISESFWKTHKGICTLHVLPHNTPAIEYWEKLLTRCGYAYEKSEENGMLAYKFRLE